MEFRSNTRRWTAYCCLLVATIGIPASVRGQEHTPVKRKRTLTTAEFTKSCKTNAAFVNRALRGDTRPFTAAVGHAPAKEWVTKLDDWFWDIMPATTMQRVVTVGNDSFGNPKLGCPIHGQEIYTVNAYYPWIVDCEAMPYRITCPIGGETYPSNDYAAGDLTAGPYADDGRGCLIEGKRYYFLGLYAHYAYNTVLQPAIKSFGDAYLATDDLRYAHKAAICLLKEAYEYPDSDDRKERTYIPGYGKGSGMITDVVWSSMALLESAQCYDQIIPAIDGDSELLRFARERIPKIQTMADLKVYIETHLFRSGIQAVMDRAIQPNIGWGAEAIASLALMLNDFGEQRPNSLDCLLWLYEGAGRLGTAGNQFYKDGSSYSSTGYNDARGGIIRAGELVERLRKLDPDHVDLDRFPDIRANQKLERFFGLYKQAIKALGGQWTICIGDAGYPTTSEVPRTGSQARDSEYLDGFGLGLLRSGIGPHQRDLTLFYGGLRGHAHYDPLMIGLYGFGRDLLPNIGYPQSWNFAAAWEWSLFTHNTVVVNRDEKPCSTVIGSLATWYRGPGCQVMEASKKPYRKHEPRGEDGPDVTDYRRLTALIDVDSERWYVVDVFRVSGGTDHLQTWHGAYTPKATAVAGATLTAQERGTLAGEGVPYGATYTGPSGEQRKDPYCHLRDVARGQMGALTTVDYDYDTSDDIRLRLNFIPIGETELITARGGAPISPDTQVLQWAIPHRTGEEGLRSQFVTVIEAYPDSRSPLDVRRLPVETTDNSGYSPIAIEVTVPGGRDIILLNGDSSRECSGEGFALAGAFGLIRERGGAVTNMQLVEGTKLAFSDTEMRLAEPPPEATIVTVDRALRRIVIQGAAPPLASLPGQRIMIDNHGERLVSFAVESAEQIDADHVALVLDSVGDIGEGIAAGFEDGIILNGPEVSMAFAGLCRIDGRLDYSDCFYNGGHLETGVPGIDLRVRGVMGFPYQAWGLLHEAGINHVHLVDPIPADELGKRVGEGARWTIYEYGIGDSVRFGRGTSLTPKP
ncbi:MAG: hypothetical protein HN742_31630 [Lentisphaerae bacterium]|nr:hypothetical protein [Lentisphaerota bacterium]MBT5606464.1 hypothetical protein [Lentisphaerota bacterium]MBT7055674.1 hypothetical protein [Lentisphaerota bacterium]MBT7846463.1 hypothetical protein [Lentisphaerota bacterium]